jgi:hypothetical protein
VLLWYVALDGRCIVVVFSFGWCDFFCFELGAFCEAVGQSSAQVLCFLVLGSRCFDLCCSFAIFWYQVLEVSSSLSLPCILAYHVVVVACAIFDFREVFRGGSRAGCALVLLVVVFVGILFFFYVFGLGFGAKARAWFLGRVLEVLRQYVGENYLKLNFRIYVFTSCIEWLPLLNFHFSKLWKSAYEIIL